MSHKVHSRHEDVPQEHHVHRYDAFISFLVSHAKPLTSSLSESEIGSLVTTERTKNG